MPFSRCSCLKCPVLLEAIPAELWSFHLFYFPFWGSLWPALLIFHPCPPSMPEVDLVWIQMINILFTREFFFPPCFYQSPINTLPEELQHCTDSLILWGPESTKQTGSLRNQTLVGWFKAWASHKAMALKYNSALKCWGESWKQSVRTRQWELLSFVLLPWEVAVLITSEAQKHRDKPAAYRATF